MAAGAVAIWRISKETPEFAADDISGGGAKAVGGRWNRKGTAAVYASMSIALATLETRAYLGGNIAIRNAFLVRIDVPAELWARRCTVSVVNLPRAWLAEPPGAASVDFGEAWLQACAHLLLLVPSILVPEECNVVINPAHPDAGQLRACVARHNIDDPRL